jgi:hypothetical protein
VDVSLPRALTRAALRAALAALVLGGLVGGLGDTALKALVPALRAAVSWAEPAFALQHLDLSTGPAGSRVRTQVMLAHSVVVGGRVGFSTLPARNPLATNGWGDHSPGGYSFWAALVIELILTFFFLLLGATK